MTLKPLKERKGVNFDDNDGDNDDDDDDDDYDDDESENNLWRY